MEKQGAARVHVFDRLVALPDENSRLEFLSRHRLLSPTTVEQLDAAVSAAVRIDLKKAQALAEAAAVLANQLGDNASHAYASRAQANALWFLGENKQASKLHAKAKKLFERAGKPIEAARTLSTSIQPLILLGEYDRALTAAAEARRIFSAAGETLRLARLDINVGNIFHRQDRFQEALDCYERALAQLLPDKDAEGIVAVLHNIALCRMMLNDFAGALQAYQEVRGRCEEQDMPLALAQVEYNIAYLDYLRGAYGHAIEKLRTAHQTAQKTGDTYHAALCHLDLSEIYLELNLYRDASELAQKAFNAFEQLAMGYEAAKALCQLAIALSQQREIFRAHELFVQARAMFVKEANQIWPSLIDLYQAISYFNEGHFEDARQYCQAALNVFGESPLPGRAVLCRLLLAKLSLRTGEADAARQEAQAALQGIGEEGTPILLFQAHLVNGQIEEAFGNVEEAKGHYRIAKHVLETLRSGLHGEELRISFLENRLEVYEGLVELCLRPSSGLEDRREAWNCIEEAKSRCLLELIVRKANYPAADKSKDTKLTPLILNLRERLNWYCHRIEAEQLAHTPASAERLLDLRRAAAQQEQEFLSLLRQMPSEEAEAIGLETAKPVPLETIRKALGTHATLLEYFRVRDRILAAVLTLNGMEIIPVARVPRVAEIWRLLQFQLSKFRLGPQYFQQFQSSLLDAAKAHLHELYNELVAPIRHKFRENHLIVVPHEFLHQVPFHAFFDGKNYLIDSCTISYAPSASIYVRCRQKEASLLESSLVLGVADPKAPHIDEEIQAVAAILPKTKLFVGPKANAKVLRDEGPRSKLIHIATHGFFRQESPIFSGIRLGDSILTVYDLYRLSLPAEQVTLSGCSTGLNTIAAGDELIGLMRGFLFAGARSLLLTLWDVDDSSTAAFMKGFYRRLLPCMDRASALRGAMQELRDRFPHPYYWAPFLLVGNPSS